MSTSLEELKARHEALEFPAYLPLIAAVLDSFADYERAASLCAEAMNAKGGLAEHVSAALISVDVVSVARRVIMHASKQDRKLERQLLKAVITACERSEGLCAPHAHHSTHCRLHAAAARDAVAAARALLADLG
jgi:hypothetical protein